MKQALPGLHIENLTINLSTISRPARPTFDQFLAEILTKKSAAPAISVEAPALGEYWQGQGGSNGGLVPARGDFPAHYLIIAKDDIGNHEWGARGKETGATSKTDGVANTIELCGSEEKYPAANACAEYQADGHHDFYLPACAELYHCWVSVPDLFAKDCYYWSSSQRSAHYAFSLDFDVGYQDSYAKDDELRVRPVRRLFI